MIAELVKRLVTFVKIKSNHLNCVCGGGIYIGLDVKFVNRGTITLGDSVIIRPSTRVYAGNPQSLVSFGNGTEIGEHSTISSNNRIVLVNMCSRVPIFLSQTIIMRTITLLFLFPSKE